MQLLLSESNQQWLNTLNDQARGSFIIHGPPGVGKRTLAAEAARLLNCEGCVDQSCHSCQMARARSHPDIIWVEPDQKGKIGIEAIHNLQHQVLYQQYESVGTRTLVVTRAQTLTIPAQNALLKLLEEPPADTLIVLTTSNRTSLLPTISSRCMALFVNRLPLVQITSFIRQNYPKLATQSEQIAELSGGAIGRAVGYVRDQKSRETRNSIEQEIGDLFNPSLFRRLVSSTKIASNSSLLGDYLDALMVEVRKKARTEPDTGSNLSAVDALQRRLAANVNARAAFETFALEVVC